MEDREYAALILMQRAAYANAGATLPAPKSKPPEPPRGVSTGVPAVSNGGGFV